MRPGRATFCAIPCWWVTTAFRARVLADSRLGGVLDTNRSVSFPLLCAPRPLRCKRDARLRLTSYLALRTVARSAARR